jgi:hypothetical protein
VRSILKKKPKNRAGAGAQVVESQKRKAPSSILSTAKKFWRVKDRVPAPAWLSKASRWMALGRQELSVEGRYHIVRQEARERLGSLNRF